MSAANTLGEGLIDGAWFEARRGAIQRIDMLLKEVIGNHKKEAEGMKKDIDMKTKMNEATIQALHKSIAHWNDICYGTESNVGPSKCALCEEFRLPSRPINWHFTDPTNYCEDCPVKNHSGLDGCGGTPYNKYCDSRSHDGCTVDSADAAEAMLELLVSLLPDGEQVQHGHRMFVAVAGGRRYPKHHWLFNGFVEDHKNGFITGITTDGRNAFPQAKKVWEKVFAKQASWGKEGPYEWVADLPRASFIWSWPEAKTKDGKCVTCGQVVKKKKKVTKYKMLIQGKNSKNVRISHKYYESEEDFNSKAEFNRFISLILETAKEFDA